MSAPSYNPTQQTTTTSGNFAANPTPPTTAATDSYATNPTATNPTTASAGTGSAYNPATGTTTTSTTTTGKTTGSSVKGFGKAIKHGIAAVHGVGEEARGRINGAIDGAMHDQEGVARDRVITQDGIAEQETGKFSSRTKERDGIDTSKRF